MLLNVKSIVGRSVANIFAIYDDIFTEMRSVKIICRGYRLTYCIIYIYIYSIVSVQQTNLLLEKAS